MTGATQNAQLDAENPWPGLEAFEENAREFFHGRDREADSLLTRVVDSKVTVLCGRSGLGKTSLLRAGLFPLLRDNHYLPIYARLDLKPGASPLAGQLRDAVREAIRSELPGAMLPAEDESLWEYLHRDGFELWSAQNYPLTPVIVLDQFEEVFTLGERVPDLVRAFEIDLGDLAENRIPADLAKRIGADHALAKGFQLRSRAYKLLVSLREDFIPDLDEWRQLIPSLAASRERLQRLGVDEAVEAVYQPARQLWDLPLGESPEGANAQSGRDLARQVVRIVAGEEIRRSDDVAAARATAAVALGAGGVEPALLSLFCAELNEERKRRGLRRFNSQLIEEAKSDILSDYYASCVGNLPPRVAEFIESELITERGFRNSFPRDEAVPERLTDDELSGLIRLRLLRIEDRYGAQRVELTHDVLTGVVREHRDRRRAEQEKAALAERAERERRALAEAAANREAQLRRDQQRQQAELVKEQAAKERAQAVANQLRKRTRALWALVAVSALVAGFAGWSWLLSRQWLLTATSLSLSSQAQVDSANERPGGELRSIQETLAAHTLAQDDFGLGWLTPDDLRATRRDALHAARGALFNTAVSGRDLAKIGYFPGQSMSLSRDQRHVVAIDTDACAVRVADLEAAQARERVFSIGGEGGCGLSRSGQPSSPGPPVAESADAQRGWIIDSGGGVRGWNTATGLREGPAGVTAIALSADGRWLYTGGADGTAQVWDTGDGQRRSVVLDHGSAVGSGSDWKSGPAAEVVQAPSLAVTGIELSGDDQRVAVVSAQGHISVWDAGSGAPVGKPITANPFTSVVALSHDGRRVLTGGHTVQMWDVETGEAAPGFDGSAVSPIDPRTAVSALAFSEDGTRILTGTDDGVVQQWDAQTGAPVGGPVTSGDRRVTGAAFSVDRPGHFFFSTADGIVREWRRDADRTLPVPGRPDGPLIATAAIILDGRFAATAGWRRSSDRESVASVESVIQAWDTDNGRLIGTMRDSRPISALAVSPKGDRVALGGADGAVSMWDVASGETDQLAPVNTAGVTSLAFSPDGQRVAWGDGADAIRVWSQAGTWAGSGQQCAPSKASPESDSPQGSLVAYSADGTLLVSASSQGTVCVWEATGAPVGNPIEVGHSLTSVAISPDGKLIATGGGKGAGMGQDAGGAVQVWDVDGHWQVGAPLTRHADQVTTLAFDEDGQWVVSGSTDGAVRVWSAQTGQQLGNPVKADQPTAAVPPAPAPRAQATAGAPGDSPAGPQVVLHPEVKSVAITADGREIAFVTDSGTVQRRPGPVGLPEQLCDKLWAAKMTEQQWAEWVSRAIRHRAVCQTA